MNTENLNTHSEIWQRLEQGKQAKAAQGSYAGYGLLPLLKRLLTEN